jgi:uncharacterized membrane protein HdeD (DUF308 family)
MEARWRQNWWAFALRGVAAIAFGVLAFLLPGITLLALVLLFAAYAIVEGAFAIVGAIRRPDRHRIDWFQLLVGIAGIVAGVIAVLWPDITAIALLAVISAWAIVTGVLEIVSAWQLRKEIQGEWLLVLDGIVSVIFGVLLILFPGAGAIALVWLIAAYAIATGVMQLIHAFRMRRRGTSRASGTRGSPTPEPAP